jgi:hypothetical protein
MDTELTEMRGIVICSHGHDSYQICEFNFRIYTEKTIGSRLGLTLRLPDSVETLEEMSRVMSLQITAGRQTWRWLSKTVAPDGSVGFGGTPFVVTCCTGLPSIWEKITGH